MSFTANDLAQQLVCSLKNHGAQTSDADWAAVLALATGIMLADAKWPKAPLGRDTSMHERLIQIGARDRHLTLAELVADTAGRP